MISPMDVLDPISVAYAFASGITFGATALLWSTLRFPPKVPVSTRVLVILTVIISAAAGTLFFAGQIVQAFTSGDPLWPRILGRMILWEIFSTGIGFGLGVARSFAHSKRYG